MLLAAGVLMFSACDRFLDIRPVGKVIPETPAEYRALMTTAYQFQFIDRSLTDMRTDGLVVRSDELDQNNYGDIEKWIDVNYGAATQPFGWAKYYESVYYANAIIDGQSRMKEGNGEEMLQLAGEAYLMRGYLHFLLANLYGQPYTVSGAPQTKAVPVKLDLDLESVLGRSTLAHGYESYDAAERVLQKKQELEDLNRSDAMLPNYYRSVEMITPCEMIYSSSTIRAVRATSTLINKYDTLGDLRVHKYFGAIDANGQYPILKTDGSTKYRCSFRTGELYLNAAEAAAHLGNLSQARLRLLALMKKRYTPDAYRTKQTAVSAMTQDELITEILDERERELAIEGHRWFDLRRTTRPRIQKILGGKQYILEQDDARYTLTIPKEAISANPGLNN